MSDSNGKDLWKFLATGAMAVLLGMGVETLRTPKGVVTTDELNLNILKLQQEINSQTAEIIALRATANQQSVDIAGIATKVGVSAHPVVAPSQ